MSRDSLKAIFLHGIIKAGILQEILRIVNESI